MKKKTLKTLGIMVLSAALLAGAVTGCGSKETADVAGTETVAVTETEEATEMVEVTEETETELPEETEVIEETEEAPAFTVTEMSALKYATQTVNVRKGPSADHEKLGSLTAGQKVTVTGQADTGWYRIDHNGAEGFVSDKYLSDQKVSTPAKSTGGSGNTAGTNSGANVGNTGAAGNTGSAENINNSGNTGNSGSAGNAGNTGNTTSPDHGSTGSTDSNTSAGNGGSTGSTDNSGSTGSTGGTDQGGNTVVPDNSGSTDAGNSGGTATPPEGSVIDPSTGMTVPDDVVIEDWGDMQGGADDGSGLSGGTSEWH